MNICVRFQIFVVRHFMQNRESHGLCVVVEKYVCQCFLQKINMLKAHLHLHLQVNGLF